MGIITENTNWVFILTSKDDPEDRHLYDVIFGVKTLLTVGVDLKDITFIIDGNDRDIIQKATPYIFNETKIYKSEDIFTVLGQNTYKNCVIIVTGHGDMNGLDSKEPIKPFLFLNAIKKSKHIKRAVILLCQCYAGIFNHMHIKSEQTKTGFTPEMVVIGATDLTESLSYSMDLIGMQWFANITLVCFFAWLKNPIDIDGDNKKTVMDAFKYITICTNNICFEIERLQHLEIIKASEEYKRLLDRISTIPENDLRLTEVLEKESLEKRIKVKFVHQETWILNAFPAMKIELA